MFTEMHLGTNFVVLMLVSSNQKSQNHQAFQHCDSSTTKNYREIISQVVRNMWLRNEHHITVEQLSMQEETVFC